MVDKNEVIVLVVATGVLLLLWVNREGMRRVPAARLFVTAYGVIYIAWCFTVLEGMFWPDLLNLLEHMATAAAAVLFACWCSRLVQSEGGVQR